MRVPKIIKNLYYSIKINGKNLREAFKTDNNYITSSTDFINKSNLFSKTNYLIWIDTKSFRTNIFKLTSGNWVLINCYLCSIGKSFTPTIKGIFTAGPKGYSFGEARGFRCYYYTQIKDNYLIHSIPYYLDGTIKDSRLGVMATDGCIRLSTPHAKWIYENVPTGSTIYIT